MKIHKVDARGFRETGFVAQFDQEISAEEERAVLAQRKLDEAAANKAEADREAAEEKVRRRDKVVDVLLSKGIITPEDLK